MLFRVSPQMVNSPSFWLADFMSAEGFLYRNGREDKNETLVVFDDVNSIFIAVASLTDGYPVSARILLPLASPKWRGDHSLTESAPSLENSNC